jgi:hypothetical protein
LTAGVRLVVPATRNTMVALSEAAVANGQLDPQELDYYR